MKIAVVTIPVKTDEIAGSEHFYDALVGAFRAIGHDTCNVLVLVDEASFNQVNNKGEKQHAYRH